MRPGSKPLAFGLNFLISQPSTAKAQGQRQKTGVDLPRPFGNNAVVCGIKSNVGSVHKLSVNHLS